MVFCKLSLSYIENGWLNLLSEKQRLILNRAKDYYEYDKERVREQAKDKYRNMSKKDKNKKREYGKNRYHNMSQEKTFSLSKRISKKIIARQKSLV